MTGAASSAGLWIALEGGDGCGKSTQAARLAEQFDAVVTREPGGSEAGSAIREVVLSPRYELTDRTEALLMAADRAQHFEEIVAPALAAGRTVVSDRSVASSLAYQGYGRGLGVEKVWELNDWALDGHWPDVFVLLECPPAEAASRLGDDLDRIERSSTAFFEAVAAGFVDMAANDPERWLVVDASGSVESVTGRITSALAAAGFTP